MNLRISGVSNALQVSKGGILAHLPCHSALVRISTPNHPAIDIYAVFTPAPHPCWQIGAKGQTATGEVVSSEFSLAVADANHPASHHLPLRRQPRKGHRRQKESHPRFFCDQQMEIFQCKTPEWTSAARCSRMRRTVSERVRMSRQLLVRNSMSSPSKAGNRPG